MRDKPSPREVLSENLRSLMGAHEGLSTIKKVAAASKKLTESTSRKPLTNGTVGRISAASHTTDIDTLQELAAVFGLEPWQLLVQNLNPEALPRLADAAVLHQILDAVHATTTPPQRKAPTASPAHQLEHESGPPVGPAMQRALNRAKGKEKGERSKPGGVPKPGTRRRV